jgi:hypothetical protein
MIGDVISRSNGGELEAIDGYVSDKGIIKETEKKDAKKEEETTFEIFTTKLSGLSILWYCELTRSNNEQARSVFAIRPSMQRNLVQIVLMDFCAKKLNKK